MATYIDLDLSLAEEQIQQIVKKRVVREFAGAFDAEQRGEEPRISTDLLRPFYQKAIGAGKTKDLPDDEKYMAFGRGLLDLDMEKTQSLPDTAKTPEQEMRDATDEIRKTSDEREIRKRLGL